MQKAPSTRGAFCWSPKRAGDASAAVNRALQHIAKEVVERGGFGHADFIEKRRLTALKRASVALVHQNLFGLEKGKIAGKLVEPGLDLVLLFGDGSED